jgi:hypothetical protein
MGCGPCAAKAARRKTYKVKLPGGLVITKSSEAAAVSYAAAHPGSKVIKPAGS